MAAFIRYQPIALGGGGGGGGITSIGAIDSQTPSINGLTITGTSLFTQSASVSDPGMVNNTTQSFSGNKTFTQELLTTNNTLDDGSGNARFSGQLHTTNNTLDDGSGNAEFLATAVADVAFKSALFQVSGAGIATIRLPGGGATNYFFNLPNTAGTTGFALTSAGGLTAPMTWTQFQLPGNYITSLTGDVTGSGPGAAATTVAKIQGTVVSGTTGSGNVAFSSTPVFTTNITVPEIVTGAGTVIDLAHTIITDISGNTKIDWTTGLLQSANGVPQLEWNNSGLTLPNLTSSQVLVTDGSKVIANNPYSSTPASGTIVQWDTNVNLSANNTIEGYTSTATATGITTLTVGSSYEQYFTGSTTQTVKLPVTSTLVTGFQFQITNLSSGVVTVQSSGANTIQAMASNTQLIVTCTSVSGTGTASWSWVYQTVAGALTTGTVTSVTFTGDGTVLSSTPSSAVTASGTLTAALKTQTANFALMGPTSGSAANPTFRAPTSADVAITTVTYIGQLVNCGLTTSIGAGALTIALKQFNGSTDATTDNQVLIGMRSATLTSGAMNRRQVTGALSQAISSGTTLGIPASVATNVWVYAIDSDGAGTMKIGASTARFDEGTLQNVVAESFACTATNASPCVFTATAHGLNNTDSITLTGTPPTGFSTATTYYIVASAANTFQLSATPGGAAINSSSTGSSIVAHIANTRLVSAAVYNNVAIRLIGKLVITFVTAGTWVAPTEIDMGGFLQRRPAPTQQQFTATGAFNYVLPNGISYIRVRAVGPGGGGAGGGITGQTNGSSGSAATTFSIGSISSGPGSGGSVYNGVGGSNPPGGTSSFSAGAGIFGFAVNGNGGINAPVGNSGPLPGASGPWGNGGAGVGGIASFGGGGAGGNASNSSALVGGSGASGGYCEITISGAALANATGFIGTGGAAGSAGSSGNPGQAGYNGFIVIDEFYD